MKDSLHVTILYCNYFVIICCFRQRGLKLALNVCHKTRAKCVRLPPQTRGAGAASEGAPGSGCEGLASSSRWCRENASRPDDASLLVKRSCGGSCYTDCNFYHRGCFPN